MVQQVVSTVVKEVHKRMEAKVIRLMVMIVRPILVSCGKGNLFVREDIAFPADLL